MAALLPGLILPRKHRTGILLAAVAGLLCLPSPAAAFTLSDGTQLTCTVQTAAGPYAVPEVLGYANGFAGYTQMGGNGLPYITFDQGRMPPAGRITDFLFYHECAHARFPTAMNQAQAELIANCEGLRRMRSDGRVTQVEESAIGVFHAQMGVYANYFGSGQAYWDLTLACANQPTQMAETVYGQSQPTVSTGAFCCTLVGVRVGPFPPPHFPLGTACTAPVNMSLQPGVVCN